MRRSRPPRRPRPCSRARARRQGLLRAGARAARAERASPRSRRAPPGAAHGLPRIVTLDVVPEVERGAGEVPILAIGAGHDEHVEGLEAPVVRCQGPSTAGLSAFPTDPFSGCWSGWFPGPTSATASDPAAASSLGSGREASAAAGAAARSSSRAVSRASPRVGVSELGSIDLGQRDGPLLHEPCEEGLRGLGVRLREVREGADRTLGHGSLRPRP